MNSLLTDGGEMPEKLTFDPNTKSQLKFIKTENNHLRAHFFVNCQKYSSNNYLKGPEMDEKIIMIDSRQKKDIRRK
jgi:hypothetical protein